MMKNHPFTKIPRPYQGFILWLLITGCALQLTNGEETSSTQATTTSDTAIVRIVVNTVVSSGNKDEKPQPQIVVNPASQTVNALSFPGGGQHIRPSSSRPEKRKADGSLFFPDGNVMDHGTSQSATHEAAYIANSQTEEANVHIADYAGQPKATLPTGLVTTMGGTVVQGGQTTVHETRVIGTYIDGTYAQILQSTSMIFENDRNVVMASPLVDSSIQTTISSVTSPTKITISPTPTSSGKWPNLKSRPPYSGIIRSSRSRNIEDKNRQSRELLTSSLPSSSSKTPRRYSKSSRSRSSRKSTTSVKTITPSASDALRTVTPSTVISNKKSSRKSSRSRSTIHGKASARNRVEKNNVRPNIPRFTYTPNPNKYVGRRRPKTGSAESSNGSGESMEARTIEMTSPAVVLSTVMTTVTTELTQHFGSSNSLIFTTTFEQPVVLTITNGNGVPDIKPSKPTEIVAVQSTVNTKLQDADSLENDNIFNPFFEDDDDEETNFATPPLPVFNSTQYPSITFTTTTDDVTTTETILQTSFLPMLDGTSTAVFTLTQSFFVTKIIHALRTIPPPDMSSLILNPDLNAAESEHREDSVYPDIENLLNNTSDVYTLLNITDNDVTQPNIISEPTTPQPPPQPLPQQIPQQPIPQYNNNPFLNPFINPFAYLGYGGVPPGVPQVMPGPLTTSTPVYSTETIYGTKVLPIWDGLSTSYHTTKAISTTKVHTIYETITAQGGVAQNPVMPFAPVNNFGPVHTITSPTVVVTTETLTSTQVLKLMYDGYKTSYRTLLSTTETVKTLTTQATTTVPLGQFQPFFG